MHYVKNSGNILYRKGEGTSVRPLARAENTVYDGGVSVNPEVTDTPACPKALLIDKQIIAKIKATPNPVFIKLFM